MKEIDEENSQYRICPNCKESTKWAFPNCTKCGYVFQIFDVDNEQSFMGCVYATPDIMC